MSSKKEENFRDRTLQRGQASWYRYGSPVTRIFRGDFARKGYLAAVDQGIISLTNFLAGLYLAREVSPTEFGVYAVGFLALHLVRAVQEGLIVQPVNALGAPLKIQAFRKYASSTGLIQLGLAVASALAAGVGGWILIQLGNDTAGPALFTLWFVFLTWQLQEFIRRTFYARGYVIAAVINTSIASAVRLGVLAWLGSQDNLSGIAGLEAIGWGALVAFVPGLWQSRGYWTRHYENLRVTWGRNWQFGRWVLGGSVANWMALELYPILTAGMISFAAAGAYRALQAPVAPVHVILRATDTILTPRAALTFDRQGYPAVQHILRLTYFFAGLIILPLVLIVSLNAGPILDLFYGDTYLEYQSAMGLMALFYGLWFLYWPLQSVLKSVQKTLPIFIANIAAIIAMFTVGLIAIQRWGVYGTIGGQALNALIVNLVLWSSWMIILRRNRKSDPPKDR